VLQMTPAYGSIVTQHGVNCNITFARGRVRAGPSFQLGTLSTRIASLVARSDVNLFIARTADTRHDLPTTNQPASYPRAKLTQLKVGNSAMFIYFISFHKTGRLMCVQCIVCTVG